MADPLTHPTASRMHTAAPPGPSARYLLSLGGGVLAALAAFYLLLAGLLATGNLPPPAFANSLCLDEKLNFMRDHPPGVPPDLLVIGSSVAWRQFDGAAVAAEPLSMKPMNAAFCGLRANQSVYVANWMLDRYPSVRQVVMIAAPLDFAQCHNNPDAVFNRRDADAFVYGGASRWPYYMRYFSPTSLLRNARKVKNRRAALEELEPLVFDAYGDSPLATGASRPTLFYGKPEPPDAKCYQALASLAARLQRHGQQLTVVATPLHPKWKAMEDADGSYRRDFDSRIATVLKTTGAQYWDADREWTTPEASFIDAIHLRWTAAQDFSAALARKLDRRESGPVGDAAHRFPSS